MALPRERSSIDARRDEPESKLLIVLALIALFVTPGCFSMQHTVGSGPSSGEQVATHRWYALFGLLPIGSDVDSAALAGDAHDYRVTTEFTPLDVLITAVASFGSFYRQTVTLEK